MESSMHGNGTTLPELLSPAGDWESLRAAVANGADAVYFGLRRFSARGRATNFAPEELPAVFEYLRDRNTKGYVALNTLIFPDEMAEAARLVEAVAGAGADAIIVQDVGLLRLIRRLAPALSVHASTQMTQTHPDGLRLLEDWGVSRVILARELSLPQIRRIRESCTIELEVFVHGALCISFSGQCLASQTLFARSGNRGQCAQACRLPYELVVDGKLRIPSGTCSSAEDRVGAWHPVRYPLSPRDLCAMGSVGELVELGVAGFKIEGRLKSADYVAAATRAYRDAMDAAFAGRKAPRGGEAELRMAQSFSRGFTEGFLGGVGPQGLVDGQSPKSRGVRVGKVMGVGGGGILVALSAGADIRPGDGLVFGGSGIEADEQGGRVYTVRPVEGAAARSSGPTRRDRTVATTTSSDRPGGESSGAGGRMVEIAFGMGAVYSSAVAVGSDVWKTDDPQVRREIRHSYSRDVIWRKRAMNVKVTAGAGGPLRIVARDEQGLRADAEWPGPLEASTRQSLTEESIREQFSRLGNTPYELGTVELAGPDGPAPSIPVMAPKSVLNSLRRELVDKLRQLRTEAARHRIAQGCTLDAALAENVRRPTPQQSEARSRLCVLVRTLPQMEAVVRFHAAGQQGAVALAYCDLADDSARREAMSLARSAGLAVAAATTVVLMPGEEGRIEKLLDSKPDAVLVRNLAALRLLRKLAPIAPRGEAAGEGAPGAARGLTLVGDYHLNVANALSAGAILEAGADRVTACMDLEKDHLPALLGQVPAGAAEVVVRLHVPMFYTAHCLWAANLPGGRGCAGCRPYGCPVGAMPLRVPGEALAKPGPRGGACSPSPCPSPQTGKSMAPQGVRPCRQHRLRLRDRNGEEHPVLVDEGGRNTVFQSRVRSLPPGDEVLAGAGWLRVELLEESADETTDAINQCAGVLGSSHK
jgi:putative protease